MDKKQILENLKRVGLIPILRTPSADDALTMAEVLYEAGLTNLEVTMTVPGALEVISELNDRFGRDMMIGAGTVLDAKVAAACVSAGAKFIISPAVDLDVIGYCQQQGVPVLPGALTPTEIVTAWRAGADMVKIFPVSAMGGASYIKAIKAPLPQIEMVPTGGVSLETAGAFIQAGAAALGVGGDLTDLEAIRSGRGQVIAERAKLYLEIVQDARNGK